jgi:hypothetical protein
MKRTILAAVLGAALVVVPAVDAKKPPKKAPHSKKTPSSKGRCGVVNKGWVVSGDNATFTVTQNADGTYDGTVTLTAHSANHHAKKSGVNATDTNSETFNLDDAKIVFGPDVTDGADADTTVGPGDVLATDTVKLIGKVPYAKKGSKKKPCTGHEDFGSDRYGDAKIRQVTVNREPAPAPATT